MIYKQGDIILLPFPYSDLTSFKKRPALVLSNDNFNRSSGDLICCLVTTNPEKEKFSVFVDNSDMLNGKLPFKSKIKPFRLFTVDKKIVLNKLCSLKKMKFNLVVNSLHEIVSIQK
ncbi:type II toxin-antitoxin system PemK/MazF family toxin [Candidatus Micrarchaeota archaeon]|nr:type II toxin-antitoxin system PemK/MazF family toxin [Candidatus Micrarchaeota archaeon]